LALAFISRLHPYTSNPILFTRYTLLRLSLCRAGIITMAVITMAGAIAGNFAFASGIPLHIDRLRDG
jgi:hypothetical protein